MFSNLFLLNSPDFSGDKHCGTQLCSDRTPSTAPSCHHAGWVRAVGVFLKTTSTQPTSRLNEMTGSHINKYIPFNTTVNVSSTQFPLVCFKKCPLPYQSWGVGRFNRGGIEMKTADVVLILGANAPPKSSAKTLNMTHIWDHGRTHVVSALEAQASLASK